MNYFKKEKTPLQIVKDDIVYVSHRFKYHMIFVLVLYAMFMSLQYGLAIRQVERAHSEMTFIENILDKYKGLLEISKQREVLHRFQLEEKHRIELQEARKENTVIEKKVLHRGIVYEDMYTIVYNTMVYLEEENPVDFSHLIMVTYFAESNGGQYLFQMDNGPARGVLQVEPNTEKEVYRVFLKRNPEWEKKIKALKGVEIEGLNANSYNIAYNVAIAWCVYKWRMPNGTPPDKDDTLKQAEYHKRYYNTIYGDATVEGTLAKM